MAQQELDRGHNQPHQEIWELLPWYASGTLAGHELARVEQHLAGCAACQEELEHCRDFAAAVHLAEDSAAEPTAEQFAQLMDRIETAEGDDRMRRGWWGKLSRWVSSYKAILAQTPRFPRLVLAAETALVLLLAGVIVWQAQSTSGAFYRTLSQENGQSFRKRIQIRLVFAEDMTERELRELLSSVQGSLINGPSPRGVYTAEVPLVANRPDPVQSILEVFRAHPDVQLAEPITVP